MRGWLLRIAVLLALAILATIALRADEQAQQQILRPPQGSKVALIVFEDLQCPDCARAEPLLLEAKKSYNIPVVVHDFPLPQHNWAFEGSVLAHYFRSRSTPKNNLEAAFRKYIFENQAQITPENLRGYAEKFAQEHKVTLPFVVDPQGKLAESVSADKQKGIAVGIQHTPTIYVVSNKRTGQPFIEVVDRSQLFQLIDQMQSEAGPARAAARRR